MVKSGSNAKLYIQGWDTMYPNQAAGREWQTYTSDISISFQKQYPSIQGHLENEEIHVTAEDKERWDNLEVELNEGSFIEIGENNTISVKTTNSISFDEETVPTTKAVYLGMSNTLTDAQTYADEAVTGHRNQSGIHTSSDLQNKWNNHVDDDTIHVTQTEKDKWNNIVIPEIPQPIVYTEGNNIAISDDNIISVVTTDVLDNSDAIPTSKAVYDTFYEDKSFNNFNTAIYTAKADTVGTVVLSKKHFISGGRITKVEIPHGNTREDLDNGEGGYLVIEVFAEDTTQADGYDKTNPIHRYYADEYYAYKNRLNEGKYEWTFNNTECIIPNDYKVVHLSLVIQNTTIPAVGSNNNAKFRVNCLAKNDNKNEDVVFEEDDECRVYWKGNTNGGNYVAIVNVDYVVDKLDKINSSLEFETHLNNNTIHVSETEKETWNNHISNDTHLTAEQKEAISKIDAIEANASLIAPLSVDFNNHANDTEIHVTQFEKDNWNRLVEEDFISDVASSISEIAEDVDNHVGNFELHVTAADKERWDSKVSTKELNTVISDFNEKMTFSKYVKFSSLQNPNYVTNDGGKCNATCIQMSRNHFVSGDVKSVEIHHIDSNSNINGIRLCLIVYNVGEDENTEKTIDDCIFSSNTQNQVNGVKGKMIFQFDNLVLPDDYAFVKMFFAKDDTTVLPVYNNTNTVHTPRIQILRNNVANNWDEYADDECKIYTTGGTSNWYAAVTVGYLTYPKNEINSILERIIALEERISELEKS